MSTLQQRPTKLPIRAAMEARDRAAVIDAFAEGAVLRSPFTPNLVFTGRDQLAALVDVLLDALDDLGYSLGVWQGCARARTVRPLLPVLTGRHLDRPRLNSAGTMTSSGDRS